MSKNVDADDLTDLSEPYIDEASRQLLERFAGYMLPEIVGEIPVAKTILVVGKLFDNARQYHRTKNLLSFISALENGSKTMEEFEKLPEDEKSTLRGLIISQLDLHSDERQAEALGLVVDVYLRKDIDRLTFIGIVSELKNTNPLLYYVNVDAISTHPDNLNKEIIIARGPTHLLPAAFGHNIVSGTGGWDSIVGNEYTLTKLGQSFFKYVYTPMFNKYSM
jgi:hypothetical protein